MRILAVCQEVSIPLSFTKESFETSPIHDIVIRDTALAADSEVSSVPFVLAYAWKMSVHNVPEVASAIELRMSSGSVVSAEQVSNAESLNWI